MRHFYPLRRLALAAMLFFSLMVIGTEAGSTVQDHSPGQRQVRERPRSVTQTMDRTLRLTLIPDFEQNTAEINGELSPGPATPADWGLSDSLQIQEMEEQAWHISGDLPAGSLSEADENGRYHLKLGPLTLRPGDSLTLLIPFVNIPWQAVEPPPDNLAQLAGPTPPLLPALRYRGGDTGRTVELDIPFTPIRKEVELIITPVMGEVLRGKADSFRLSGQVTFDGIENFEAFERYCENTPASPFSRYRVADLLFALDYPPAFHFGFLSPVYQFKPTYALLRSDLVSCQHQVEGGQVQAQFRGRIFHVASNQGRFPTALNGQDVTETHHPFTGFGAAAGEYQLTLGEIVLAPGDRLRVAMPQTNIHHVAPPPNQYIYAPSTQTRIEYHGPRRLALTIRYTPEPLLLLRQTPATARALLAPAESELGPLFGFDSHLWNWGLLAVGLALGVSAFRKAGRLQPWLGFGAWLFLSVALLYGLRSIFGWLLLAVTWYFFGNRPDRPQLIKGAMAILLVLVTLLADAGTEALFAVLSTVELNLTPFTPLILILLSVALSGLVIWKKDRTLSPLSHHLPAAIFFFFTLTIYDVLQKSLPALVLITGGAAWITYRLFHPSTDGQSSKSDLTLADRFRLVRQSWLVPAGVLLFTILAMQHNLQQTAAVFGPALGLWGPILLPVLLFISVLLALSAIAGLFILIYPALPFEAGYLKALQLGLFLLAVFVLGVGSDDRLINILDTLLAGRLIYYLSMPLLIGLYFDIDQFRRKENIRRESDEEQESPLSFEKATGLYLKRVQGFVSTLAGLLSLVAPSLYAFFFDQPIVTTYFDLLEQLISLTLIGI